MLVLTLTAVQTLDYAAKGSRIEDRLGQILGLRVQAASDVDGKVIPNSLP